MMAGKRRTGPMGRIATTAIDRGLHLLMRPRVRAAAVAHRHGLAV
jgi:hypothetical protein